MWNLVKKWEKIWLTDWVAGGHWILSCTYAFRHPLVMPRRVWAKRIQGCTRRDAVPRWSGMPPHHRNWLNCVATSSWDAEISEMESKRCDWFVVLCRARVACGRRRVACHFKKSLDSGFWIPKNWDMFADKTIFEEKSLVLDQNKKLPHWVHNTYAPLR